MVPLKWAENDPCITRGQRGVVESIGPECATVRINEARVLFVGLDELELVPLPDTPADRFQLVSDLASPTLDEETGEEVAPPILTQEEALTLLEYAPTEPAPSGDYQSFVSKKLTRQPPTGLGVIPELHPSLFPFQRDLVSWALRRGRAALFADTGLGKTAMQLEWARRVHEATKRDVLILAPLAVASQTAREGERLGIPVTICRSEADVAPGLNITNYDRLHRFDPARFGAVVLDESSIIKHHDAKTLATLLAAFRETPFRLCATATPSPNDYTELGTHAEFLGVCTRAEMLAEYFVHDGGSTQDWRLKGHARGAFWRWMSTWAALIRKPSDLGYDDAGYDLPELRVTQHTVESDLANINATKEAGAQTSLFVEPAKTLTERRTARKGSLGDRVQKLVELVTQGCEQCRPQKIDAPTTESTTGATSGSGAGRSSKTKSETQSGARSTQPTPPSASERENKPESGRSEIQTSGLLSGSERSDSNCTNTAVSSKSSADAAPSADASAASNASTSTTAIAPDVSAASSARPAISDSGNSETTPSASRWPRGTCGCPATEQWLVWVELNEEEERIVDALGPQCIAVRGSHEPLSKETRAQAWMRGDVRILVSKPSIFGFGLNFQFAARMAFVGVKDSWEAYYQAIRREWRFGQKRPVHVHVFASELEGEVVKNLQRKERDALAMAEQLSAETRETVRAEVRGQTRQTNDYKPAVAMTVPSWMKESA